MVGAVIEWSEALLLRQEINKKTERFQMRTQPGKSLKTLFNTKFLSRNGHFLTFNSA